MSELLAEVVRSGYVEGTHSGSVVALGPDGDVVLALGEVERPVFPRSSNKPSQVVGLLEAGWQPATDAQLAVATASHNGEPGHLEVVREVLRDLELGNPAMPPLHEPSWQALLRAGGEATPLTHNCSGKHAAMLRTCAVNGWPTEGYLDPDHPVQQACLAAVERLAGERVQHVAVDGCGAPQHALTLTGVARAFRALATGPGHEGRTGTAMRNEPWYVGGTDRDVTALMRELPGLVVKDGAEGVVAAGLADGSAVALKIEDGAGRARMPVLVAVLRRLGLVAPVLDRLAQVPVLGGGRQVGEVRVAGRLAR